MLVVPEHEPCDGCDDTKVVPDGSVSVTVTLFAVFGPALCEVSVNVTFWPTVTLVGLAVFASERSADCGAARSQAPISHAPSCGRVTSRWSSAGQSWPLNALSAGLPSWSACVFVWPPLSASASSLGSVFCLSVASVNLHVSSSEMLNPLLANSLFSSRQLTIELPVVLPETMVFSALN